jgi:hypothetical protein
VLNPSVEEIDLASLARALRARFGPQLDENYLDGRTILRDAVVAIVGCSALEAEELVDTLEGMHYLRFPQLPDETHSARSSLWEISAPPLAS